MTDVLDLIGDERLSTASMFAVEFVDPVTDLPIRSGLRVWADDLGQPIRTLSGRYAWNDIRPGAPGNRTFLVHAASIDGSYADFEGTITVPPRGPGVTAAQLLKRVALVPTGLYVPPAGATAFAGDLVAAGPPVSGLPGVAVAFFCVCEGTAFPSSSSARTDTRGGFVAVLRGLEGRIVDLKDGVPASYLQFTRGGTKRFTGFLPIQPGRLGYAATLFAWDDLSANAPQP